MNPRFCCTRNMADSKYVIVWVSCLLISKLPTKYSIGLRLHTKMHFIDGNLNAQRSWGLLLCHTSSTINSCCSISCTAPCSAHNSRKLDITHQPLSMFRMLWMKPYDGVFHLLPVSSNFKLPLKSSDRISSMQSRCVALHDANSGNTRFWLCPPNSAYL